METTKRTTESILANLHRIIENKEPMDAEKFIDAALYLNILLGDDHEKLLALQQKVSQMQLEYLEDSKSVAEAKLKLQGTDEYREMKSQELKVQRIVEYIRIAKKQAEVRKL